MAPRARASRRCGRCCSSAITVGANDEGDTVTSQLHPDDPTSPPGDGPVPPLARPPRTGDPRAARRAFLAAVLRTPSKVGAIAPTSEPMAELLTRIVPRSGSPVVVELGPGTGAVTGVIDDRLPPGPGAGVIAAGRPPGARHVAVELDPAMAAFLQRTHPGLEVVEGDAVKLGALLAEHEVEHADAVVSGLPWSLFDDDTQASILSQIAAVVAPDGAFTTFAYRHG